MISNKLEQGCSFDPTKQSQSSNISTLNQQIDDLTIVLPIYQRNLSWPESKMVSLFNYQLFGKAPVAPISFNKLSYDNKVNQVDLINREIIDSNKLSNETLSIIDGQQRLATNYKAYINHESVQNIVLDANQGRFKLVKDNSKYDYQIPVGILLNKNEEELTNYLDNSGFKSFKDISTIAKVRTKLTQYSYTIHIANRMIEKEQIEWFEVLNNAGSKVTALQMAFAKLGSNDFDIYREYAEPFSKKIAEIDMDNLFKPYTTNVSYPVALLTPELEVHLKTPHSNNFCPIPSDTKEKKLARLDSNTLKMIINETLNDLDKALALLKTKKLYSKIDRMDYILYLAGYYAHNKSKKCK
ncbi:GmrSD restriction endonuclease domain-containing protein [Holzapfeliella floricola]|uniref:GmrSD restriction endonuclease domain-containing protein n=1 Tax=Holzapfeliella floricola TaxID=679249 RepID=UPI000781A173|nr:DUF262 domain-containing protein [Holzapfeliella floricola]